MLNYTDLMADVVADIAKKTPGFSHLRPDRIAIASTTRWAGSNHGVLATCVGLTPLDKPSFSVWVRRGTRNVIAVSPWYIHRPAEIVIGGERCLYLILLRLPRLLHNNPLETLVHELFHISEKFDGRLRSMRHGKTFDRHVRRLTREWLERAEPRMAELAQMKFTQLRQEDGPVVARCLPTHFQPSLLLPAQAPEPYESAIKRIYPGHRLEANYRIKPVKFTPANAPHRIDERALSLRVYNPHDAQTIPRAFARYLGRRSPGAAI